MTTLPDCNIVARLCSAAVLPLVAARCPIPPQTPTPLVAHPGNLRHQFDALADAENERTLAGIDQSTSSIAQTFVLSYTR
jgi:hypothetical protein